MNINITGPYNSLGYGQAVKHLLIELNKLEYNIAYFPIGQIQPETQEELPVLQKIIGNQENYDVQAPSVRIYHQFDLAQHIGKGKRIGFPIFELDKFNPREMHHLATQDMLFVCSNWAKDVLKNNLPGIKTEVIPLGFDNKIFYPEDKYLNQAEDKKDKPYIFMNIGKWEIRKGHDILIDVFNKAFTDKDNVELWLLPSNPFLQPNETQQWIDLYKKSPLGDKITILDRCETQQQIAGLMRQADCGIFPSRAEGWNLDLLEMLACGKQCITTNYSAHTEFCTKENTLLIDIDNIEPAIDGKWFFGQGNWAKFEDKQIEQSIEHMQYCYKNQIRSNLPGLEITNKFTWQNSAKILAAHLDL